jgi:histidinol-phosphate aminotransferase
MSRIITLDPTYGMYSVCAGIQDVAVDKVLLNPDYTVNPAALLEAVRFDTRMMFLCSPNNPTGNQIPLNVIRCLAAVFSGIIVVDEAYIDFAEGPSALALIAECRNIVVLQTFSKAWGMAGVRLGMAFADPEVIRVMNKVKYPYNVNVLTAEAVIRAIDEVDGRREEKAEKGEKKDKGEKKEKMEKIDKIGKNGPDIREILWERSRLADRLKGVAGVEMVYPSDANFLLVRFTDPKATYKYLAAHRIIVRDRSGQSLCQGCLRITVGTPAQNDQLITALMNQ